MSDEEEDEGLCATFCGAAKAKVAGSRPVKVLYYGLFTGAIVMFLSGISAIRESAMVDISEIKTQIVEEVTFPEIWMCLPSHVSSRLAEQEEDADMDDGARSPEIDITARTLTGTLENYIVDNSTGTSIDTVFGVDGATDRQKKIMGNLERKFSTDYCFLTNTNKEYKPKFETPTEFMIDFRFSNPIDQKYSYAIYGFIEPGGSPFNSDDEFEGSYFRASLQNSLAFVGWSVDKYEDARGFNFLPNMQSTKTSSIYKVNADSFVVTSTLVDNPGVMPDIVGDSERQGVLLAYAQGEGYGGEGFESYMIFYVADFAERSIKVSNKSFSTIWAEIGGAFSAALIIIGWAFREEVVESKTKKGATERVQVLRFNSVKNAKMEALAWAKEQAKGIVLEQAGMDADAVDEMAGVLDPEASKMKEEIELSMVSSEAAPTSV